jgi:hypothetical protein
VLRIRFLEKGQTVELDALCELAADGLPAAYACEQEVVTSERSVADASQAPQPGAAVSTLWTHNGSVMRLVASGASRSFVYEVPRRGLVEVGVKPGDVVLEGRREGQTYTGTAFIFTQACGRVGYPVSGQVLEGERRVVVTGEAPLMGPGCTPRAYRHDRLQFDLVRR